MKIQTEDDSQKPEFAMEMKPMQSDSNGYIQWTQRPARSSVVYAKCKNGGITMITKKKKIIQKRV